MRLSSTLTHKAIVVAAIAISLGCQSAPAPTGQILIYLDTDAPLPRGDTTAVMPLFDRMTIEVFPPNSDEPCEGCVREFPADGDLMRARAFSFGVVPLPRQVGSRLRLRLFRTVGRSTPRPESTIELVGYLPAISENTVVELTAHFLTDKVGKPSGSLSSPILFDKGAPVLSQEGSWQGAVPKDCEASPPTGAGCITGGAYFMGDPRVNADKSRGGQRERLVSLSPFFLDYTEVTVAAVRASGLTVLGVHGKAIDPKDDSSDLGECNYTTEPGGFEDFPVMCVSWQLADKFCKQRGGYLPTEAQFEYVASMMGTRLFPWGDREPSCTDAVVARNLLANQGGCLQSLSPFMRVLSETAGTGLLDKVLVRENTFFDLGANLSEWTQDVFQLDTDTCWSAPLLYDPHCDPAGTETTLRTTRGGNLFQRPLEYVQLRTAHATNGEPPVYPEVGFRCAYPASQP